MGHLAEQSESNDVNSRKTSQQTVQVRLGLIISTAVSILFLSAGIVLLVVGSTTGESDSNARGRDASSLFDACSDFYALGSSVMFYDEGQFDADFDPYELLDSSKPYDPVTNPMIHLRRFEGHLERFTAVRNMAHMNEVKRRIAIEDRLADGGWKRLAIASLTIGALGVVAMLILRANMVASFLTGRVYRPAAVGAMRRGMKMKSATSSATSRAKSHFKDIVHDAEQSSDDDIES